MQQYITELSKYFITLFMAFYTLECFLVFRHNDEESRSSNYITQCIYLFLIQFLSFLTLCLETGQIEYLFFYAFLQIAIFATIILYHMIYPSINRLTIHNMCMLLGIGLIMLSRIDIDKAFKQFMIVVVSLIFALIIPVLIRKMKFLRNLGILYACVGILALGIVLILGQVTLGSKISYTIAGVTVQPSEFVKIIFVFFVAAMLQKSNSFKNVVLTSVLAATHVLILVLSKDLGSSLIFFIGYIFMLLIATKNYLYLMAGFLSGSVAAYVAYKIFYHVQVRVLAWQDPWSVIDNEGYQITQSLFAIGTGSWFGMGLYQGNPQDIPYVETDFMFSAIAEEFGTIFAICMILVCVSCFIMFMNISVCLKDQFYRLIAAGLGVMYIFQVFLTIGGGIKFIPLTGVTLPLVSYGGSSVLTSLIMFAVIQGLYMVKQDEGK
ncbi:MAG: FtsW/RodA/SpoVE family cell cycle protein [Eubacteriales bacterium]